MMKRKDVVAKFRPFMEEKGFTYQKCFIRIQEDLVFCLEFEAGALIYPTFFMIPLYIPSEFLYFDYGGRLMMRALMRDVGPEEMNVWYQTVEMLLEQRVFPQMEEVSSPQKLMRYLEKKGVPEFMRFYRPERQAQLRLFTRYYLEKDCEVHKESAEWQTKLRLFTRYYPGKDGKIRKESAEYRRAIENSIGWSEETKEAELRLADELEAAYRSGNIAEYFAGVCSQTLQNCFGTAKAQRSKNT